MQKITLYFAFFMIAIYVGMALIAMFTDVLDLYIQGTMKYILGTVLLLYAAIRGTRTYRQWIQLKQDLRNENN
jgi:hypothetical protein